VLSVSVRPKPGRIGALGLPEGIHLCGLSTLSIICPLRQSHFTSAGTLLSLCERVLEVAFESVAGLTSQQLSGWPTARVWCSATDCTGATVLRLDGCGSAQEFPGFLVDSTASGEFCFHPRDRCLRAAINRQRRSLRARRGVVIGASRATEAWERGGLASVLEHAVGLPPWLHRLIDSFLDFEKALETHHLGFKLVFTQGGATIAPPVSR